MYKCIYIIESPCCTAEINKTLQINYVSIKIIFLKIILRQKKKIQRIMNKRITVSSYIHRWVLLTFCIFPCRMCMIHTHIYFFQKQDFPVIVVLQLTFPTLTVSKISPGEYVYFSDIFLNDIQHFTVWLRPNNNNKDDHLIQTSSAPDSGFCQKSQDF